MYSLQHAPTKISARNIVKFRVTVCILQDISYMCRYNMQAMIPRCRACILQHAPNKKKTIQFLQETFLHHSLIFLHMQEDLRNIARAASKFPALLVKIRNISATFKVKAFFFTKVMPYFVIYTYTCKIIMLLSGSNEYQSIQSERLCHLNHCYSKWQ